MPEEYPADSRARQISLKSASHPVVVDRARHDFGRGHSRIPDRLIATAAPRRNASAASGTRGRCMAFDGCGVALRRSISLESANK